MDFMSKCEDNAFDLAICDPPYWPSKDNRGEIRTTGYVQSAIRLGEQPDDKFFNEIRRISKEQIVWGANNYNYPFKGYAVWNKTNIPDKFTMSKCEIASLSDGLSTVSKMFSYPSTVNGKKRIHPTQKPVELYEWLLRTFTKSPCSIIDPFLGSGSSRIAAYQMGYDFTGCELNKDYYDAQEVRFANFKKQVKLF